MTVLPKSLKHSNRGMALPFDNNPPASENNQSSSEVAWSGLEERIQRLLDIVMKLRAANGQLMYENQKLKLQSGQLPSLPEESQDGEMWRRKYEESLNDIRILKDNIQQMKKLMDEQFAARQSFPS
jgi:regulator of replication initiation timing